MLPGLGDGSAGTDDAPGRTQSLYRKYRPQTFASDELVGQEHISRTLRNAIVRGRVAHAYLFCGPRGTGKTTTARLLAKAVNCLHPDPEQRPCNACEACRAINEGGTTDIIEIDAASNRGIDDMRNLREQVRYAPTQLGTKFYIVDEAHQITKEGFNAFLKTLEEPPPRTTFVLATTDPDKLPETIASRCQRFDFRRIPREQAAERVRDICRREGIAIDDDALEIVVRRATGSLRDALSLVDMLASAAGEQSGGVITVELVRRMLGISQDGWEYDLVQALADRDIAAGLTVIGQAVDAGHDMRAFGRRALELLRVMLLVRAGADPVESNERIRALATRFELPDLLRINQQFADVDFRIRNGGFPQLPLELALVASLVGPSETTTVPPRAEPARPASLPRRSEHAEPAEESRPARDRPRAGWLESAPRPEPAVSGRQASNEPPEPSSPRAEPASAARRPAGGNADLQRIVASWERIRTEVKLVNVRAEALLASADPARIDGEELSVIAAYPFHASKLSEPKVRALVEDAVAKVTGARLRITFVLREELQATEAPQPASLQEAPPTWRNGSNGSSHAERSPVDDLDRDPPLVSPSAPDTPDTPGEDEDPRLGAVKAIFDATVVDE
jgi:DNA polymerase-3 subunit gamma/tau